MMPPSFLDLLAAEAPAEAFDQAVAAARAAGMDAENLARLEAERDRALQVRGVLEERRRREQELAALYATAGDLTSLRDVGAVLEAIVRRARQLLATDTTYLMLLDPERGDTYMRVTDGTVSADFEHVRLPLGRGLGGLVAETASPYFTADYHHDERFTHLQDVDDAVAAEGLRAILGVPLRIGDRVIGVLFASNRRERPFASHEVTLLSSLAAHAAIAIDNARLFTEAGEATARAQAQAAAVERAAEAHERLTAVVLGGGGVADVAEAVADLLGRPLLVVDASGVLLAHAGDGGDALHRAAVSEGALPRSGHEARVVRAALDSAGSTQRVKSQGRTTARQLTPVVAGSERLGALVLEGDLDDADLRTLERASLVTAVALLHQRSLAEAERRVRGELLDDLLDTTRRDAPRARRGARLLGVDLDAAHVVVVASHSDGEHRRLLSEAAALARDRGGLAGEHRGRVVLLVRDADASGTAALVARRLGALSGDVVTAGAAGPAQGPEGIAAAHAEAERTLRALLALGMEGQGGAASQLGAFALALSQAGRGEIERFVEGTLGPILAYDEARGTDLVGTLDEYFACGGNLSRAADALHCHPNTLYQRFDRVARLVGEGWREGDAALQLHLAVRLHRLHKAL